MSAYVSYVDGGKTSNEGLFKWFYRLFTSGNNLTDAPTSMQVVQRGAGANMSVDISIGDVAINYNSAYSYYGWQDALTNVAVTTSSPSNPRIDTVVVYIDLAVVSSASNNNPNALKFLVVAGTPAGSPAAPSGGTIQAAIGGTNPYKTLANLAVATSATQVVNANITDTRTPLALKARLWGGSSNTNGHIVPNIADDTVALLAAPQTFTNKTFSSPIITGYNDWQSSSLVVSTITNNGNRSYTVVYTTDPSSFHSVGQRARFTRTVAAPTQSTLLNGTTQYYSKSSPNKLTFTDDFVADGWVKLTSYPGTTGVMASRYNGTSGWVFSVASTGQVFLQGYNAGAANHSDVNSQQSLPLNKWVHVTAQLDMSTFTATPTTSYVMFDGIDVGATVARTGSNPTALIQAGNLEIGSTNGGTLFFPGKLAQVAIYNAKVTQATIAASMTQTLVGNETSLASAYSFNNSIADLNTTTPNDLTPNGSAVATNADSPYAQAAIAGTLEYAIATNVSGATVIYQVPEGSALPTSGGISAVSYSGVKVPYGFPANKNKWYIDVLCRADATKTSPTTTTWYDSNIRVSVPVGSWEPIIEGVLDVSGASSGPVLGYGGLSATSATAPDTNMQVHFRQDSLTTNRQSFYKEIPDNLVAAIATTYYLNFMATATTAGSLNFVGSIGTTMIRLKLDTL